MAASEMAALPPSLLELAGDTLKGLLNHAMFVSFRVALVALDYTRFHERILTCDASMRHEAESRTIYTCF
jgi:hypothetical protein